MRSKQRLTGKSFLEEMLGPPRLDGNQEGRKVSIGDFDEVETLGGRVGRVVEVRDGEALVAVGALKLAVPRTALRISTPEAAAPAVSCKNFRRGSFIVFVSILSLANVTNRVRTMECQLSWCLQRCKNPN